MLGSEVMRCLAGHPGMQAVGTTLADLDITDSAQVNAAFRRHQPTHVIHCAAWTLVDLAEKEADAARRVNGDGSRNVALACRDAGAEMIYISTDYVFDGRKGEAYSEGDRTGPLNVYGATKLLGEVYVQTLVERHKIVRTSWLNGLGPSQQRNFIETMLRLGETRPVLSLISDQTGRPTFTFDLARALVALLDVRADGVFHVTNSGEATWFEFAREIFLQAGRADAVSLRPILTEQYPTAARRPAYSVLDNNRFAPLGLAPLPPWRDALREYFRRRALAAPLTLPANATAAP